MDDKTVAKLIIELIGNQSRNEFARKAGVKPMSISRWTNGTKITLLDFEKLCLAAGRQIHEVLNFGNISESLQKEFNVPEEYSLSVRELLKELLELQQENYQSQNSDNFIKLMTRHIRETKETLRTMKVKPEKWLSIDEWTDKIGATSEIMLVVPPDSSREIVGKYAAIYVLKNGDKIHYCSYVTKGGGTSWSYLRSLAYSLMVNRIRLEDIHCIVPNTYVWAKLWGKQFEEEVIPGEFINYDDKNLAFNSFLDLVGAYYRENSESSF